MKSINKHPYAKNAALALVYCLLITLTAVIFMMLMAYLTEGRGRGNDSADAFSTGSGNGVGNSVGDGRGNGGGTGAKPAEKPVPGAGDKPQNKSGSGSKTAEKVPEATTDEPGKGKDASSEKAENVPIKQVIPERRKDVPIALINPGEDGDSTDEKESEDSDISIAGGSPLPGGRAGFFGEKIPKDEDIVFIVDISPSMQGYMSESMTRFEAMKAQLKNALDSGMRQKSRGKYMIVAFHTRCTCFPQDGDTRKQYSFSKSSDRKAAEVWIDALPCGNGTDLLCAIQLVYDKLKMKEIRVDQIFILTDGETDGHQQIFDLLQEKEFKRVKIFTVSLGTTSDLLKEIANRHRGTYREFR